MNLFLAIVAAGLIASLLVHVLAAVWVIAEVIFDFFFRHEDS